MHLFASIPQPDGAKYTETFAPLIRALFSPERVGGHGPYYFVRTHDGQVGADTLQISIDEVPNPDSIRDDLQSLARQYGCVARVDEVPREAVPSPMWNAGFSGSGFSASSQRLFQEAAPALVAFLNRAAEEGRPLFGALGALRLMTAHTRATLLRSPQRSIDGYELRDLLSLRLLSYRSHFEAVYLRTKDPESFEAACARFYEQVGPTIRAFIEACGDPNVELADDTPAQKWTELITSQSSHLAETFLAGSIVNAGYTLEDLVRERGAPVEPTRFHTPPSPELDRLMHRDADFLAFRLQTSLLYSGLYSLGFSLAERYVFCYVIARANEEVCGKSMQELQDGLDDLAKTMAAVPSAAVE
ncbi:hypothetical protein [Streptomyces wuyuanensis]|uniref:Lantibiotic biosynthesis dehydratase C-term n=1 Tax=Streptomyces wuyuanensis TaxID=1196353 RepID=A0A1G9VKW3_9ACTN|nr:hypothetical protein [Streptomyces wuyuanensis]SDM72681.1 hypothetical protein SAMN05444921_112163 [Streptomyces wuyuanensis]